MCISQVSEWTKQVAEKWRNLDEEARVQFRAMAAEDKTRFDQEVSVYKFNSIHLMPWAILLDVSLDQIISFVVILVYYFIKENQIYCNLNLFELYLNQIHKIR